MGKKLRKLFPQLLANFLILVMVISVSTIVEAKSSQDKKIKICHATASVHHPYNLLNVDKDSADGNTGNDHGKKDHSLHAGPVFSSSMQQGDSWGDIIPSHDNFAGLNWNTDGQAIWNNGCKTSVRPTPTPSVTVTPTPTVTPTVTPSISSTSTVSPRVLGMGGELPQTGGQDNSLYWLLITGSLIAAYYLKTNGWKKIA